MTPAEGAAHTRTTHTRTTHARAGSTRPAGSQMRRRVSDQRARYAGAVLSSLARSQQGRPVVQIQQLLRNCLGSLGVRLPPATMDQLATDIAAGRPVAFP